ncbi:hypothetical protein BH09PLA1_BH09PLA1_08060 [soil metagenome]
MKITRERKIIAGVLVVALAWLGFDQLGASPASADAAAEAGNLLLASTSSSHNSGTFAAGETDGVSLASRLSNLAEKTGTSPPSKIRDVFSPADSWGGKSFGAISTVTAADQFALDHTLSTFSMSGSGGGVAVIDGKLLHINGTLDGYKLVAIHRDGVVFRAANGAVAKLKLASESLPGR